MGLFLCNETPACSTDVTLDAPENQVTQHSLSTVGMSDPSDVGKICICEYPGGPPCETIIAIDPCGTTTPVYQCTMIDCNGNTLYIDWWISTGGTDFDILLRL